jgi:hypothetical protein
MERVTRINSLKVRFLGDKVLQRTAWTRYRLARQLLETRLVAGRVEVGVPSRHLAKSLPHRHRPAEVRTCAFLSASSERRVKSIPKALPVRRWQARQLQMETANGSPSTSSCSWPQ